VRKTLRQLLVLLGLVVSLVPTAQAHENPFDKPMFEHGPAKHDHSRCEDALKIGDYQVISSGRDEDTLPLYLEYLNELMGKDGVLEKLGLSIVPQVFMFAPGNLVSVLSAMNMFPVGHWHDGAQIARAQASSSGILELVYPGGNTFRQSIYRDDLDPKQQISIINHVIGHVIFGMYNRFSRTRSADNVRDSYEMFRMMEHFYVEHGHDEVEEWYQFLLSMRYDQDMLAGIDEPPEFFKRLHDPASPVKSLTNIPRTRNLLQYFVATLPANTPYWKLEMAKQFEKLHRYIPGAIRTKFMNEGLATLFQELLPAHATKFNDFAHHMEACCLLGGVGMPRPGHVSVNLQNPYFLGWRGGWRNLRNKYHSRPELAGKSLLEKDRAFLHWAITEIIPNYDDNSFFPMAMDASWMAKENLYISRPIQDHELNGRVPRRPPPPELGDNPGFVEVVTRDPEKIMQVFIEGREASNKMMPTPSTIPSMLADTGILELENVDGFGSLQPLKSRSMVAKLWTMANVRQAPVALETTFITIDPKQQEEDDSPWWWRGWQRTEYTYTPYRIRTMVTVDGRVDVSIVYRNEKTGPESLPDPDKFMVEMPPARVLKPWVEAQKRFQGFLNEYIQDLYLDAPPELLSRLFPSIPAVLRDAQTSVNLMPVVGAASESFSADVFDHAPTVPRSLVEFTKKLQSRLAIVLKQAIQGRTRVISQGGKMRVRALPIIPSFEYNTTFDAEEKLGANKDEAIRSSMQKKGVGALVQNAAIDGNIEKGVHRLFRNASEIGDIDSGDGQPGDVDWGPRPQDGQSGPGDQDGEGQPGDDPAQGRGDESNDPSWVEIPPDIWGQLLGEEIELPNLRRLEGESDRMSRIVGRHLKQKAGIPRFDLISRQALKLGISDIIGESNGNLDSVVQELIENPLATYNRGLNRLRSQDWFVKGFRPRISPDLNVAVYIQLDFSGSMAGWIPTVKKMAADLRALLMTKYKTVKIYFVPFDGRAVVVEDLEEMLRMHLGGGTSYGKGFKETREHMDKFHPYANWDRIPVIIGDLIDSPTAQDTEEFETLAARSQYVGVLKTGEYSWPNGYSGFFESRKQTDEYLGYETLATPNDYAPIIFRALFKNPPK
jgi:uncharacterized sporulation protein YeaH/YhbH (DUF444 family)